MGGNPLTAVGYCMIDADECRQNAERCFEEASSYGDTKARLMELAQDWLDLKEKKTARVAVPDAKQNWH